jgi:hypothetical protein
MLWFEKLAGLLKIVGYTNSEVEPCVFRKIEGSNVHLLVVYLDDILMIVSKEEMERLQKVFVDKFQCVTIDVGKEQLCLGM